MERQPAHAPCQKAAGHVAGHEKSLCGRRVRGADPRQGNPHRAGQRIAFRQQDPQGRIAALERRRRAAQVPHARKCSRLLPLHRRRVRLQARERRPDAHVCRRGRCLPHEQALSQGLRRHAGQALVHGFRFGHALWMRPGPASRHLWQDRQLGCVYRHARRPQGVVFRL